MHLSIAELLLGIGAFLSAYYFRELNSSVKDVVKSVQHLNTQMAVIIERTEIHSGEIESLRTKHDNFSTDLASIRAHIGMNK